MKIKTKQNKPFVLVAVLALLLIVSAAGTYAYFKLTHTSKVADNASSQLSQDQQSGIVNYDTPTKDQQNAGSTAKDQASSQNTDTSSTPSSSPINVTINGGSPKLTALLSVITNTGTCTLTLTGPSAPSPITVNIQAQSSYSVCEGFDTSTLTAGDWTAKVDVKFGTQTGTGTYKFTVVKS